MLRVAFVGSFLVTVACGSSQKPVPPHRETDGPDTNATITVTKHNDKGPDGGAAPGTSSNDDKPFAGSAAEATSIISAVVDKRQAEIASCIREFRARRKMAHDRVAISFGIDQEGKLLGVTSKGKEDAELKGCVQEVLKNAPFPRSHAGVITVTKSYEEIIK